MYYATSAEYDGFENVPQGMIRVMLCAMFLTSGCSLELIESDPEPEATRSNLAQARPRPGRAGKADRAIDAIHGGQRWPVLFSGKPSH